MKKLKCISFLLFLIYIFLFLDKIEASVSFYYYYYYGLRSPCPFKKNFLLYCSLHMFLHLQLPQRTFTGYPLLCNKRILKLVALNNNNTYFCSRISSFILLFPLVVAIWSDSGCMPELSEDGLQFITRILQQILALSCNLSCTVEWNTYM